jgi:hypothetical protein
MSKNKQYVPIETEGFAAVASELPKVVDAPAPQHTYYKGIDAKPVEVKAKPVAKAAQPAPERTIIEIDGRIAITVDGQPVAYYNSKEAALKDLHA